jgi:NTP pyrophosphatase (non-canonical NTP hydrolase)
MADSSMTDLFHAYMAKNEQESEALFEIAKRIDAATDRYGQFASTHEALGVALEEWTELVDAVRSNKLGAIKHEALDLAAVCIRLALACAAGGTFGIRSTK